MPRLALIGDHREEVVAHRAIPQALALACQQTGSTVEWEWLGTQSLTNVPRQLADYAGIWCVPGSPYNNLDGVLAAIRFAREKHRPFLGTCGGFQHALIEFARNVLGIAGAEHAEDAPEATDLVVTLLACSLVGQQGDIVFTPGSQFDRIFGGEVAREAYHCNYGPNPAYRARFEAAGLHFTGFDREAQIRACELVGHPFFVGTLFQPERAALAGRSHPLIEAFVRSLQR
jgi:CTP synthase (UTP-ammonia lyase)